MDTVRSSETLAYNCKSTRRYYTEDQHRHLHWRGILKVWPKAAATETTAQRVLKTLSWSWRRSAGPEGAQLVLKALSWSWRRSAGPEGAQLVLKAPSWSWRRSAGSQNMTPVHTHTYTHPFHYLTATRKILSEFLTTSFKYSGYSNKEQNHDFERTWGQPASAEENSISVVGTRSGASWVRSCNVTWHFEFWSMLNREWTMLLHVNCNKDGRRFYCFSFPRSAKSCRNKNLQVSRSAHQKTSRAAGCSLQAIAALKGTAWIHYRHDNKSKENVSTTKVFFDNTFFFSQSKSLFLPFEYNNLHKHTM
jgi:hypothetical protein